MTDGREFARLWQSWRASTSLGHGDAWSPYVASVRAWALCGVHASLVAGTPIEATFVDDLVLHAGFIRSHLELDVGGNHLIKNLKALVGLGVFLGDHALVDRSVARLDGQMRTQVLADGGHFERSPSYHCQVLADLLDVRDLLAAAGGPGVNGLDGAITRMREWLGRMVMPDGDVPLFNDCTRVGTSRVNALGPIVPSLSALHVLDQSGYVIVRPSPRVHMVADVGPPCPPELPAHAHADCLSFELAVDGRRVVVDTGTSTYEPGATRRHERSTAAHNTVEVDGADQTEVWGTFRAARRARATLEHAAVEDDRIVVRASHDGYARLPGRPIHTREWTVSGSTIAITDIVSGGGRHRAVGRLYLADGASEALSVATDPRNSQRRVSIATDFGVTGPGTLVETTVEGDMPLVIHTALGCDAVMPA